MNYNEFNDYELISMINEPSEDAKDVLYKKYYYIIDFSIKKYKKMAFTLGIDYKDLYQEAMLGFADALNRYDESKDANLKTFISLCVDRRLQVAVIKAGRFKNKLNNEALSLDHVYEFFKVPLAEIISDNNKNNPLEYLTKDEEVKDLINDIDNILSDFEKSVFDLMLNGIDYQQIATILNVNTKSIDNSMQRIKAKVRKVLADRN